MKPSIWRWFRHGLARPGLVGRNFPPATLDAIGRAVATAEQGHSGEIRFAIESALPWSYLRRHAPPRQRALMIFAKLRVWDTEHNNGVLIYVGLADRAVEIVADRGIAARVDAAQWRAIHDQMLADFKQRAYADGSVKAVLAVGELLRTHFPLAAGETHQNTMSDRPVII